MYSNNNVPDGTNTTSHLTDTTNNPQSVAKVLRNYIQTKHVPMNNVVSTNISVDKTPITFDVVISRCRQVLFA